MKYYIFRNSTIELFFNEFNCEFSGYGDSINFDDNFDRYIFFYNILNKTNSKLIIKEIEQYKNNIDLVLSKISENKTLIIFTLERTLKLNFDYSENMIDKLIYDFNLYLYKLQKKLPNVKIISISNFYEKYSIKDRIDFKYYFMSNMEFNPAYLSDFTNWVKNQIRSIELKRKKCIVLDLDNTLWGGILGEDGIDGIRIGNNYPGNAFLFFQQALLELKNKGIILTVCSKNNEEDVFELWENHSDIILRKKDFIVKKINWQDKADNIIEISNELNIGLDSIVFIDDNPTERELVKKTIPDVTVPDFPKEPYLLPNFFNEILENYFSVHNITKEDLDKSLQYENNISRNVFKKKFNDIDKFISELEIILSIEELSDSNISRFAQMTQKTNQFNLTTNRYTDIEINAFRKTGLVYGLRVKDKFGDNGITGLIMININHKEAIIDSLLLSCRILGKRIEFEFMKYIILILKDKGISTLKAKFIKTKKNIQTENFFEKLKFQVISKSEEKKEYKLDLTKNTFKLSPKTYKFL